jgi:hypothetical protein
LVALGVVGWLVSRESSDRPLAFDLGAPGRGSGRLADVLSLARISDGRRDGVASRWLVALAVVIAGFFLPWALFSRVIGGGGALSRCLPACPENVLELGSAARLVEVAGNAETYGLLAVTVATLAVYVLRLRSASRPGLRRRRQRDARLLEPLVTRPTPTRVARPDLQDAR